MKWTTLLLLTLGFISSSFAEERKDCFNSIQKHISEAIEHNSSVKPRYARLSNGDSNRLSATLITLEKMSRLLVKNIERETRIYQQEGIGLLCDELADMKALPPFQESLDYELRPTEFYQYDHKGLNQKLKKLMKQDQLEEAYQLVALDLHKLEEMPYQQCLTRHFLESIARTLKLSDKHREEAIQRGLPDPLRLIKKFITLQRRGLVLTNYLDTQAFPLQKNGVLIYCQDVPAILWK